MFKRRKNHIRNGESTFCGIRTEDEAYQKINTFSPWSCSCRNCLYNYYYNNPLTLKRTKEKHHV